MCRAGTAWLTLLLAACQADDGARCGDEPACEDGWLCDRGECRKPCIADDQCAGFEACRAGLCEAVSAPACNWDGECEQPTDCETVVGVRCRAGQCHYPHAPDGFPCNRNGGQNGYCASGLCLPTDTSCQSNGQCDPGTCIEGSCGVPAGVGGTCDTGPDDHFDCQGELRCISGVCLVADGGPCAGNGDCVHTCIELTCRSVSDDSGPCDADDDDDCDFGLTCHAGGICGPGVACLANAECTSPSESCIEEICRERAATGAACDAGPDDDDDCVSGHACIDGICLRLDGQACAGNNQCVNVCIGGLCAGRSGTLGNCDGSENADCQVLHACLGGVCRIEDGHGCAANDECVNICIAQVCAEPSGASGPCDTDEPEDCGAGLDCSGAGVCLLTDGGDCVTNAQCINTCIGSTCAPRAVAAGTCDPGDDDDCLSGLRCHTDDTCAVGIPCPGGNGDCTLATESCIAEVCRVLAPTGAACDEPSDHADCQPGHACMDGECLRVDGESCVANTECVNACIDLGPRACAAESGTSGPCDTSDDNGDCQANHQCTAGFCLLGDTQACTDNDQCVHVCLIDTCGPPSAAGGPCDQDADCLQSTCAGIVCAASSVLRIFATAGTHDGAFGNLVVADDFCRNDADNPLGAGNGAWAAMLGIAGAREVGSSWIMLGSTSYFAADGATLIDVTDGNGWPGNGLSAPIHSPQRSAWTGLSSSGGAAAESCGGWTLNGAADSGVSGRSSSTGRQWVDSEIDPCDSANHIYCVEQP